MIECPMNCALTSSPLRSEMAGGGLAVHRSCSCTRTYACVHVRVCICAMSMFMSIGRMSMCAHVQPRAAGPALTCLI